MYSWLDVFVLRREILCIKKLRTQRNPSAIAQSVHSILEQSGLVEDLAADCAWNKVRKGPSPCIKWIHSCGFLALLVLIQFKLLQSH